MNSKEELRKQLIILTIILVFVIILAIILNTWNSETNNNINLTNNAATNENIQNEQTEDEKVLENLKGLLEETNEDEEEYIQDETEGTENTTVITGSGETVIIKK